MRQKANCTLASSETLVRNIRRQDVIAYLKTLSK